MHHSALGSRVTKKKKKTLALAVVKASGAGYLGFWSWIDSRVLRIVDGQSCLKAVTRLQEGWWSQTLAPEGSEEGSYSRLLDFLYHSTLGSRVIKKKKKTLGGAVWGLGFGGGFPTRRLLPEALLAL